MNGRRVDIELIREHILCDGFLKSYTTWTWHGEVIDLPYGSEADKYEYSNMYSEDCMEEMIRDIGEENFQQTHMYDSLKDNSTTNLYPGCLSFSRLLAVLRLFNIKARNGWTDRSFTELLEFWHEILHEGNSYCNSFNILHEFIAYLFATLLLSYCNSFNIFKFFFCINHTTNY